VKSDLKVHRAKWVHKGLKVHRAKWVHKGLKVLPVLKANLAAPVFNTFSTVIPGFIQMAHMVN
jgi:hypothetical protein